MPVTEAWQIVAPKNDGKLLAVTAVAPFGQSQSLLQLNSTGALDDTFPQHAIFEVDTTWPPVALNDFAIYPDGSCLVGGYFNQVNGVRQQHLARLSPTGTLDPSYRPEVGTNAISGLVLQKDGSAIVVVGGWESHIMRFTSDGKIDAGYSLVLSDPSRAEIVTGLQLQSDGKLLLSGYISTINGSSVSSIARVDQAGQIDQSFQSALGSGSYVFSLAAQSDGKLIVCGNLNDIQGQTRQLVRLNSDGSLDQSFDFDKRIAGDVEYPRIERVGVQPNGRILFSGWFSRVGDSIWPGLAALKGGDAVASLPMITVQPSSQTILLGSAAVFNVAVRSFTAPTYQWQFNGSDIAGATNRNLALTNAQSNQAGAYRIRVRNPIGETASIAATLDVVSPPGSALSPPMEFNGPWFWTPGNRIRPGFALIRQPDGSILVGGSFTNAGSGKNYLARFDSRGEPDQNFKTGQGPDNEVEAIALQSDGKILCSGAFSHFDDSPRPGIARLNPDGIVDLSFSPQVVSTTPITALALQSDGKILAAGTFTNWPDGAMRQIVRMGIDGMLDPTFLQSTNVLRTLPARRQRLLVLPDDKFLAIDGNSIVRLHGDGSFDSSFQQPRFPWPFIFPQPVTPVTSIELGAEGRILVGGETFVAQLNTDGSFDSTFTPPSIPQGDLEFYSPSIEAIAQTSTGDIAVGGVFTNISGQARFNVARLRADGTLDAGFDPLFPLPGPVDAIIEINGDLLVGGAYWNSAWFTLIRGGKSQSIAPVIVEHPHNQTVKMGRTAQFSGRVSSSVLPVRYQWQHNGVPIAGATDASLSVTNVMFEDAGDYQLTASNDSGSSTSGIALLTVESENHAGARDFGFLPPLNGAAAAVLALPNNQLLVAAYRNTLFLDFFRINGDGTIDPTFHAEASGSVFVGFSALALQPDGRILIGGPFNAVNGIARNGMARLNTDGSLDESFDAKDGPNYPTTSSFPKINQIVIQPDGMILAIGYFSLFNQIPRQGIARLFANGHLDPNFDPGTTIDPTALPPFLQYAALQPDGRILLGGQFTTLPPNPVSYLARFNSDGTLDASFEAGMGPDGAINGIAQQADGRILISGGFASVDGQTRPGLARLDFNGRLDSEFFPEWTGQISGIALQADGKILVGGGGVSLLQHGALTRLNPDGSLDRTFSSDVSNASGRSSVTAVAGFAIDSAGHVVAVGAFQGNHGASSSLVRVFLDAPTFLPKMLSPHFSEEGFDVLISTISGERYSAERVDSLPATAWSTFPLFEGVDRTVRWVDFATPSTNAFYRIRRH